MSSAISRFQVWIAFALLCAAWGSSYLFIRIGVEEISPLALVALRLTIGSLTILAIVALRRLSLRASGRQLGTIVVAGTINTTAPFLLISWGETSTPSGLASILNSTTPIFALLLAGAILQDEPITGARLGGVLVGFVGVIVLLGRDISGGVHWSGVAGQGAIIGASMCYAIGAVFVRRTLLGVPAMTIATYGLLVATVEVLGLSAVFSPPPLLAMSPKVWLAVTWLGIVGSGLAYTFAYFVLEHWGASRYTLVTYVLPVIGLTLGAVFLGEVIDWHIAAGSVLVIGGIVLASVARGRRAQTRANAGQSGASPEGREPAPVARQ
jgi:drug/metabolite transporter (DMT)-like permease